MNIPLTEVKSSNINAVGYDTGASVLAIQFSSGALYHYKDVPPTVYGELLAAESIGKYFSAHVRNAYKAEKQAVAA